MSHSHDTWKYCGNLRLSCSLIRPFHPTHAAVNAVVFPFRIANTFVVCVSPLHASLQLVYSTLIRESPTRLTTTWGLPYDCNFFNLSRLVFWSLIQVYFFGTGNWILVQGITDESCWWESITLLRLVLWIRIRMFLGPPGSGSVSQRYRALWLFILEKWCKYAFKRW